METPTSGEYTNNSLEDTNKQTHKKKYIKLPEDIRISTVFEAVNHTSSQYRYIMVDFPSMQFECLKNNIWLSTAIIGAWAFLIIDKKVIEIDIEKINQSLSMLLIYIFSFISFVLSTIAFITGIYSISKGKKVRIKTIKHSEIFRIYSKESDHIEMLISFFKKVEKDIENGKNDLKCTGNIIRKMSYMILVSLFCFAGAIIINLFSGGKIQ